MYSKETKSFIMKKAVSNESQYKIYMYTYNQIGFIFKGSRIANLFFFLFQGGKFL